MTSVAHGLAFAPRVTRDVAKQALREYGRLTASRRSLPDFAIIGAKRGGTTSLYNYLLEHPLICPMFPARQNIKGTHYFDTNYWRGIDWYRSHFSTPSAGGGRTASAGKALTGEGSPYYLFHPLAASRLAADAPSTKLIVLLRNPVERAYSHYKERVRHDAEPLTFLEALEREDGRLAGEEERIITTPGYVSFEHENHSYVAQGAYVPMLRRWMSLFDPDQVLVLLSEDFYTDPNRVANEVWTFLGLPAHELQDRRRFNYHDAPDLDPDIRRLLEERFASHSEELADLLGRRLPWPASSSSGAASTSLSVDPSADRSPSRVAPPLPPAFEGQWPAVTVVVPTRDRPQLLQRAVQSILNQNYKGPITCTIVFDRSDPTPVDVEVGEGRELRLVRNVRSPGLAGARNSGYLLAATPLIANCDDDDEWHVEKLSRQVEVMLSSAAELVSTGIVIHVGDRAVERVPSGVVDFGRLLRERVTGVHPSSYLIRREAIGDGVGLVDEELPGSYGEDYEWLLRFAWRRSVVALPEVLTTITWSERSYFSQDWRTISDALSYLLEHHPEIHLSRRGLARIQGQIAFAEAADGQRKVAIRAARAALRAAPLEKRGYVALAVAMGLVPAPWIMRMANRVGRGI